MPGKKGMKHYPLELKLEAMPLFYEEGKTRKEITAMLGIRDKAQVMIWLRQYRREGDYAFLKKPRKRLKKDDPKAYIAQLEMEVDLLKKNSIPSCARNGSRSAIPDHLSIPRKILSESDVCLLRDFASCLLCLGKQDSPTRSRCRRDGLDPGSL